MEKWQKYLQILGLTDAESKVYLFSLKAGPKTVLVIARSVSLSRVTIYNVIESLTKLGLMTSVEKGKKQLYAAEPPERVVALANNRINNMQATVKEINHHIDELKLMQSGDKPVVKMFKGPDTFKAIQEDLLNYKYDDTLEFGNLDDIEELYPYLTNVKFFEKLAKKNIERRCIFSSTTKDKGFIKEGNKENYYYKNDQDFHGDIIVYGDKVWISRFRGEQMAVQVKDQLIADVFRALFNKVWTGLKNV